MYSPKRSSSSSKLPPKSSLSRSTSNGVQVGSSSLMQVEDSGSFRHSVGSNSTSSDMNIDSSTQVSSGLMRYRSAPSSFLASLVEEADDYLPRVTGSHEPDHTYIARYFSADSSSLTSESSSGVIQSNGPERSGVAEKEGGGNQFGGMNGASGATRVKGVNDDVVKHHLASILENGPEEASTNRFCNVYQAQDPQSGMEQNYRTDPLFCNPHDSMPASAAAAAVKGNLTRHSSSPAGFLSRLASVEGQGVYENGFLGVIRNMTNLSAENRSCGDLVAPCRLASQMSFMKQGSSTTRLSSQLSDLSMPEVVDNKLNMPVGSSAESLGGSSSDDGSLGNANGVQHYIPGFSVGSWDGATIVSEGFADMQNGSTYSPRKRPRDLDGKNLSPLPLSMRGSLKVEAGTHLPSALTHQYSLPKSSSEMVMERLLQDSVPCKIRAKRGCATHPRSIAERVRRTRISERMRKLQELVPNMDKQTNTADMLDEAVEYIKLLQRQVQELSENQSNCTCSSTHAAEDN